MVSKMMTRRIVSGLISLMLIGGAGAAYAYHAWGFYHWARTSNPFTLKLGDNLSSAWDPYLAAASSDWSQSSVLDTMITTGSGRKNCRAIAGMVQVCNAKYGNNGWLGIAQIWITGGEHITQGVVKVNDTYFSWPTYNTPAWKQFVMCQEVGHEFGLDHQDENMANTNLGTCMDYTNNPARDDGLGGNLHPNAHDYEELETIYAHADSFTSIASSIFNRAVARATAGDEIHDGDLSDDQQTWGHVVRNDKKGRPVQYERNVGKNQKVITHVIWAE